MGTSTTTTAMTIAEFDALPDDPEHEYELHEGKLVEVTFPIFRHGELQERLHNLLSGVIPPAAGIVRVEMGFQIQSTARPTKRRADVAFLSQARADAACSMGIVIGAPELVVEVLSPSNTASQVNRYARLCLANGAEEFWTVDPDTATLSVRQKGSPPAQRI
jgi:Uma2 family endonuclease